jgi:hypothetical protein
MNGMRDARCGMRGGAEGPHPASRISHPDREESYS